MDRDVALSAVALSLGLAACGGSDVESSTTLIVPDVYADEVVRFSPGSGAGFGEDQMPSVVLGAPQPLGDGGGSLDVLSLGVGGEVVLGFSGKACFDAPGPDFVVFENPFAIEGGGGAVFAELGEVSVSADGQTWFTFACDPSGEGPWPGCAGWRPTRDFDVSAPLDAEVSGGDAFDLADVGLDEARFVKIRDLAADGAAPTAGFDLDAVGLVHVR